MLLKIVGVCWLNQTHGDTIVDADNDDNHATVAEGDAAIATRKNHACVIMTADCLPVLLSNRQGTRVAALHCGWQGLYQDLIGKTLTQHFDGEQVIAWLGPAIGAQSYEVDDGLYQRFTTRDSDYANAFTANRVHHYLMDLYAVARLQLQRAGVLNSDIFGGNFDTLTDARFFSHRRSAKSGRIASIIYIQ